MILIEIFLDIKGYSLFFQYSESMEERIPMNTKSLQKHFKSEYENFFAKNDLVVSANHSFAWNLGFGENKDKIHIRKKIPTKTFCGINIINENKVEFGSIFFFDILENRFYKTNLEDINKQKQKIEEFLLNFLQTNWYEKWVSINLMSETPRWHGLAFSWTMGSLIATWIYLTLKKINDNSFKNYDEFVQSKEFREIFNLWLEIEKISKYGNSVGNNCYSAMINSSLPTITFSEDSNKISEGLYDEIYNYKIKDFLWIKNNIDELSLDYWVIFSWITNKVEQIQHQSHNYEHNLKGLEKTVEELLHNEWMKNIKKFPFKNLFTMWFAQTFKDIAFMYNFKTIACFKKLLEKWFNEEIMEEFIQTQRENNFISSMVEGHNHMTDSFDFYFNTFKKFDNEMLSICPVNFLKIWGSFIFISKFNKSRETIFHVIQKMKEIWYQNITLEYASRLDGASDDGIRIEQWINIWIFSEYIQKDQVYYKDNQGESYIGNYNEILGKNKTGLLLDMMHNKMYLNGKKLTSSDLCSQTTTISILYQLMENIWADMSNKEFEISSYSKNKNEMLGKIVLPLIGLIEKETGEVFPLICKGSIYDFYMKLNPSIIKVAFVKKI